MGVLIGAPPIGTSAVDDIEVPRRVHAVRRIAVPLLLAEQWLLLIPIALVAQADGNPALHILAIGGAIAAIATVAWRLWRTALVTRALIACGLTADTLLLIYALTGRGSWQLDAGHMWLFVVWAQCLALLCWRSLILSGTLVIIHHLGLSVFAPHFVFPDGADPWRVVLHAGIVAAELGMLTVFIALIFRMLRLAESLEVSLADNLKKSESGERLLRDVIEAIPYPVFYRTVDGDFAMANRAFLAFNKIDRGQLDQLGLEGVTDADDVDQIRAADAELIAGRLRHISYDTQMRTPATDDMRHVHVTKSALSNNAGEVLGIVGTVIDRTEARRAERDQELASVAIERQASELAEIAEQLDVSRREALAAMARAEEANVTKSRFLAHMSHELRTPLNAIMGFAEVIRDEMMGPIGNRTYSGYAADIHKGAQHLNDLINDILDMAKIEAGKLDIEPTEIDAAALAADATGLVKALAKDRQVRLRVDDPPQGMTLWADARATKQMILNLLSNAVKFTPEYGVVTLSFDRVGDGWSEIRVADTGVGMTQQEIAVALEPFGQIDGKLARDHKGTGLGLPLVKSMVELHGGALAIDSTPGEGTVMTLRLPGRGESVLINA